MSAIDVWRALPAEQRRRVVWTLGGVASSLRQARDRGTAGPVEAQYVRDGIEAFESAIAVLDGEVSGCRECGAVDPCVHDAGGGR